MILGYYVDMGHVSHTRHERTQYLSLVSDVGRFTVDRAGGRNAGMFTLSTPTLVGLAEANGHSELIFTTPCGDVSIVLRMPLRDVQSEINRLMQMRGGE